MKQSTLRQHFRDFLEEQLSWTEFCREYKLQYHVKYPNPNIFIDADAILNTLDWSQSFQGDGYWSSLQDAWAEYYKNITT